MGYRRKNNNAEVLGDFIGMFWQVGAVITVVCLLLIIPVLSWAISLASTPSILPTAFNYLFFLAPVGVLVCALTFGLITWSSYKKTLPASFG